MNNKHPIKASRGYLAVPLLFLTLVAELCHVFVVSFMPHPVLASNLFQIFFPLLAVFVSFHQRTFSVGSVGRRCWITLAVAFAIWASAEGLYIYFLYRPVWRIAGIRLDDALWVLFGLPLLLAVNTSHNELDRVRWLDRAQAALFFVVLYLLVFLPSGRLSLSHTFLIQNFALTLCCLLRLPICVNDRERRFFVRLTLFLIAYSVLETCGDLLYSQGWKAGSPVDLVWTLPVSALVALVLRDALLPPERASHAGKFFTALHRMQGLNVAALAFLSIGLSVLLTTRHPLLGGGLLTLCFALFAYRTNAREDVWYVEHKRLEETALTDPLTGLGNRLLLRRRLTEQLSQTSPKGAALLFVDLDRFKLVNDSLGHAHGDRLLIEVGRRLCAAASPESLVCRLGGDEFVVLITDADASTAQGTGEKLLDALHGSYELNDHVIRCSASIGVVLASVGERVDDLLRIADHAMYRAKQLGRDRVQVFDATLLAELNIRWQMEADLRDCIDRDGIDVAFQPILGVADGEITGFEALARWSHPIRGQVPPSEFISLAEDTGLILCLGAQVLKKACRQVAEWNLAWGSRFSVSVNVSPRQFADTGLLQVLLSTLAETCIDPSLLRIEITESALLVHEETVKHVLSEARKHGIRVSLDDFGTGYSSLSFLLNLPVDEVKVDRSFVSEMHSDPRRRELVRTVIQLSHALGKRVVAEGVETEHDLQELTAMGCECAQGWLISRPLLAAAMEADMPSIRARNAHSKSENRLGTPLNLLSPQSGGSWNAAAAHSPSAVGQAV